MKKASCVKWSVLLSICLMAGAVSPGSAMAAEAPESSTSLDIISASAEGSYAEYLEKYADMGAGTCSSESGRLIIGTESLVATSDDVELWKGQETQEALLFNKGDSYAEYSFSVESEGMYYVAVEYAVTEESDRNITAGIMINGECPFKEAGEISIPRIFQDATGIRMDGVGNEVTPRQILVYDFQKHTLMNTNGYYDGAYRFYLKKGKNTLRLTGGGTPCMIKGLELVPAEDADSYEEYLRKTAAADSSGQLIKIPAEVAAYKSDSVLYPNYDRVNLATEDSAGEQNNAKYIRINTIGGSLWNTTGQWISWEVEVPEDGYYNLGCRYRQNFLDGLFTSRAFYIDGELLFAELGHVEFGYDDEWQIATFSDENGEPYKIYLTKGSHEIKAMCTMGEFADTLRNINDCIYEVNDLYRQIIMITSTSPDSYTDYYLEERVPGLVDTLRRCRDTLAEETDRIVGMVGKRGSKTAILETLRVQLDSFIEDTEEISVRLSGFKDNISAVGSWLVDIQSQGLLLDYLFLKSPDVEEPGEGTNFLSRAWYSVSRFLASFDDSTLSIGGSGEDGNGRSVTVWLNSSSASAGGSAGRDQAQVIKDLIDENFTPETGIVVDLQLVQGSLIEATLAGMGPDVALMIAEDQPVNFAIRGALQDLTVFEDWEEVAGRFYDSAATPFWYNDGLYALPDTQVFNMLFYRTDVFEELGIKAPETWEDFYAILPVIQRNNLQITVQDIFPALFLQNGGSYYSEDGTRALLDSQEAIDAMTTYTDLYVKYGFEIKTDFYSRFRSGELVMSIQPYNMYNQLMVAAPEIKGLWEMVPIPGKQNEDGSINNTQNATVTGTVMLDSCEDKESAWEFMKWWSRDDVKAQYAVSLEGMLGASARFTPANQETLAMLPWSDAELEELTDAWESVVGIPQLPGSYYTARGLTNAFRSICYSGDFPRYAMRLQTKYINEEITRKREEFGLTTAGEESGR